MSNLTPLARLSALGYTLEPTHRSDYRALTRNGRVVATVDGLGSRQWSERIARKLNYLRNPLPARIPCPEPGCGAAPKLRHNGLDWVCCCDACFVGDHEWEIYGSGTKRQAVEGWNTAVNEWLEDNA
jgi:hypothetical protein